MKLLKTSLVAVALTACCVMKSSANIVCNNQIPTPHDAEECLKNEILTETQTLYEIANTSGHLGDVSQCTEKTKGKSYFTENKTDFDEFSTASVEECKADRNGEDKYWCWVSNTPTGCYISKGKSELVNRSLFILGKSNHQLATFYPIP